MDYFYDPNNTVPHQASIYDIHSSTSSSPKPFDHSFSFDSASFQPTSQTWTPMNFDDLGTFDNDSLPVPGPASSVSSADTEKSTQEVTRSRRRAQNRASQRAFRERKDRHLKGLEFQLEALNEKHQDLIQSYTKQSENVTKLQTRLAELRAEMKALKSLNSSSSAGSSGSGNANSSRISPNVGDSFDAFSFTVDSGFDLDPRGRGGDDASNMMWREDSFSSSTMGDHDGAEDMRLPAFEDLLRMA
ncbi:hypothetical protein PV10_05827 [Exophiala mesophila]|uniref:BZIP domain-containing protein n=1 Tax=Exophiala mesophila TaxID=212818 RepID=A0A0D1ZB97_EXOME|nr:uncharacterized protein PV10_05827 [Exophiala mesophila]KIV91269.1 hypothetical protein PV10_05827 [Exophiala mesophila]